MALLKCIIGFVDPLLLKTKGMQSFFQLSIFLFIPIFICLLIGKYKYETSVSDIFSRKKIPYFFCVLSMVVYVILLIGLFALVFIP